MFTNIDKAWVTSVVSGIGMFAAAAFGVEFGADMQTAIVGIIWAVIQGYVVWQTPNKA